MQRLILVLTLLVSTSFGPYQMYKDQFDTQMLDYKPYKINKVPITIQIQLSPNEFGNILGHKLPSLNPVKDPIDGEAVSRGLMKTIEPKIIEPFSRKYHMGTICVVDPPSTISNNVGFFGEEDVTLLCSWQTPIGSQTDAIGQEIRRIYVNTTPSHQLEFAVQPTIKAEVDYYDKKINSFTLEIDMNFYLKWRLGNKWHETTDGEINSDVLNHIATEMEQSLTREYKHQ